MTHCRRRNKISKSIQVLAGTLPFLALTSQKDEKQCDSAEVEVVCQARSGLPNPYYNGRRFFPNRFTQRPSDTILVNGRYVKLPSVPTHEIGEPTKLPSTGKVSGRAEMHLSQLPKIPRKLETFNELQQAIYAVKKLPEGPQKRRLQLLIRAGIQRLKQAKAVQQKLANVKMMQNLLRKNRRLF